jgi:hypothetical protein
MSGSTGAAVADSLSSSAWTQFDCLHPGDLPGFHRKSQQSADEVPSIVAAGSVQKTMGVGKQPDSHSPS